MKYKIIDQSNYAINQARILKNGNVEVLTTYLYGKPCKMIYTKENFIKWRNDINNTSEQENKNIIDYIL